MSNVLEQEQLNKKNKVKINVIDCDVHPIVHGGLEPLYPYMTREWKMKFEMEGHMFEANRRSRYPHPRGAVNRRDAAPSEGMLAGSDPEFVRKHYLDEYDVKGCILIPLQPAHLALVWQNNAAISTMISAYSDYLIDHWLNLDNRYHMAITVNPKDPAAAVKEIKRLAQVKGVAAVYLPMINLNLGDRYFYPIYEAALEAGLPIMCHVSGTECSYIGAPMTAGGLPGTYNERYCTIPQIAQTNVANLIFEGVFEKYPDLKVIFVEYAFSWLGPLMYRMNQIWQQMRIETPWVKKKPSEYVRENIFFTTQPADELPNTEFNQMLETVDAAHNLLFASDYPHWDNDMPDRTFDNVPLELRKRILHDNAMNVFGSRLRV